MRPVILGNSHLGTWTIGVVTRSYADDALFSGPVYCQPNYTAIASQFFEGLGQASRIQPGSRSGQTRASSGLLLKDLIVVTIAGICTHVHIHTYIYHMCQIIVFLNFGNASI